MIIGVSDNGVNEAKYVLYEEWLREGSPGIGIVRLTPGEAGERALGRCDGLVLTGGGDVDPSLYGGDPRHHTLYEISAERDSFESRLAGESLEAGRPILGICRGMQLVNVALGGSLITDLVEAGHRPHGTVNGVKCRHEVILEPGCALAEALGTYRGSVSSSHHQAADRIGKGLGIAARSEDGVVEALEMPRPGGGFKIILVQWHPERMDGAASPLSGGIRDLYFESIKRA